MGTACASLIDAGALSISGTGLGTVPTTLTLHATGNGSTEAGCVAWTGSMDVTGSCTTGLGTFTGGQENTGASQTGTQVVTSAMDLSGFSGTFSSYANLGLVMNINQPAGGSIDLTNLILTVYGSGQSPKSVSLTCPAGGCVFSSSSPGLGSSDELFGISSSEVASLGTFSSTSRIGVAASFTGAAGGPESFFLAAVPAAQSTGGGGDGVGGGPVQEPASLVLLVAGIISLICLQKRRHT